MRTLHQKPSNCPAPLPTRVSSTVGGGWGKSRIIGGAESRHAPRRIVLRAHRRRRAVHTTHPFARALPALCGCGGGGVPSVQNDPGHDGRRTPPPHPAWPSKERGTWNGGSAGGATLFRLSLKAFAAAPRIEGAVADRAAEGAGGWHPGGGGLARTLSQRPCRGVTRSSTSFPCPSLSRSGAVGERGRTGRGWATPQVLDGRRAHERRAVGRGQLSPQNSAG